VLVALAEIGGTPATMRAGNVRKLPPPRHGVHDAAQQRGAKQEAGVDDHGRLRALPPCMNAQPKRPFTHGKPRVMGWSRGEETFRGPEGLMLHSPAFRVASAKRCGHQVTQVRGGVGHPHSHRLKGFDLPLGRSR
jgi:hypothetical protein